MKKLLVVLILLGWVGLGYGGSAPYGWYWGVQYPPVTGSVLWVGPYPNDADCADMYGSAIYAHPWACHLDCTTAGSCAENCKIVGNGFAYPKAWPYPVPPADLIAGTLNCTLYKDITPRPTPAAGWYFLWYSSTGPHLEGSPDLATCRADYTARSKSLTSGEYIGYYSDSACPGAPCFSVGTDTACE